MSCNLLIGNNTANETANPHELNNNNNNNKRWISLVLVHCVSPCACVVCVRAIQVAIEVRKH